MTADQPLNGLRLLLAEDTWAIALHMSAMLEDLGAMVVATVGDAGSAERLAAEAEADCAIFDVELRDGTCYRAAELARSRGMAVVFTTGHEDLPDLPPTLADVPRLLKPVDRVALKRTLEAVVQRP